MPAPLFSDLEISKMTFAPTPHGEGEIKHSFIEYDGERLEFQLAPVTTSLRCPFGVDDGSKFKKGKPSLNVELPPAQHAFFQKVEVAVKEAAVAHKDSWFDTIKPSADAIRASFVSRVKVDEEAKYPPTIKVNVLLEPGPKQVKVHTSRRLPNGKITKPETATADAVVRGARVVPVLRTVGGVWVKLNAKKKTFEYGLVFAASELLVIEETNTGSSFNFGDNCVASENDEDDEPGGEDSPVAKKAKLSAESDQFSD